MDKKICGVHPGFRRCVPLADSQEQLLDRILLVIAHFDLFWPICWLHSQEFQLVIDIDVLVTADEAQAARPLVSRLCYTQKEQQST